MTWKNVRRIAVVLITLALIGEMSDPKTAPAPWIVFAWTLFLVFLFVRLVWRSLRRRRDARQVIIHVPPVPHA
jgi:DMSO/TMAO reductase YedYZ heme-binding membrane subunit